MKSPPIPDNFILVLDDYHMIDSEPIDHALTFLLDHLPRQMHLVIATREDPSLPLARFRVRGQLTELRAADLRFTPEEAAEFLNRMMSLNLSAENIAALETRTEGWIAGLQLAALSLQGREDIASFIQAFTGSHRFVLDYLVEEVLSTSLNISAASYCKPLFSTGFALLCAMPSLSEKMAKKCWMSWNGATCFSFRWMISANGIAITTFSPMFCKHT